jgi:putative ABC transport system permease protein
MKPASTRRIIFLAELQESLGMALSAVTTHKLRSTLTLLGILVGVFSIIMVMTALRAVQSKVEQEMTQLGSHTFQIQRWPAIQVNDDIESFEKYHRRKRLTLQNAYALRDRATLARTVSVSAYLDIGIVSSRYAQTNPDISLRGWVPETFETQNFDIEEGRAISDSDVDSMRLVCVLGADLAKKVFPFGNAVGDTVKFEGVNYTVIGVLKPKGAIFGQSMDAFFAIPISTAISRYGRETPLSVQVQSSSAALFPETMEQVRGILRSLRKVEPGAEDDFEIVSNDSLIEQLRAMTLAIRAGAGIISSIALVAAGIGIMNIMLVSVTERTREIGIRRAIGAKKRHIMTQFILEAIVLCEFGGIAGVLLGIVVGNVGASFLKVPPVMPVDWALIGLIICSLVGIIFGTYPAWKAANLDPIESLRYE